MSFRVEWRHEARDRLQREWLLMSRERKNAAMDAFDEIERVLSDSPTQVGESRGSDLTRVLFHGPLVVAYRVDPNEQRVSIVGARVG